VFFWTSDAAPGIRVAFTDRSAGNLAPRVGGDPDAAARSRQALEEGIGVGSGDLHFMNQTHSTGIAQADRGHMPDADALISPSGKDALAVLVADCVPVVLVGSAAQGQAVTAVVHAGRKGVEGNIAGLTVEELRRRGADAISAWIGPSVCGTCYEVPEAMRSSVVLAVPSTYSVTAWGTPALDLPAGVRAQLDAAGADVHGPDRDESWCTLENERLFSHRASFDGRPVGRLAGLIWHHG
jgi:polyphenol oxidase